MPLVPNEKTSKFTSLIIPTTSPYLKAEEREEKTLLVSANLSERYDDRIKAMKRRLSVLNGITISNERT